MSQATATRAYRFPERITITSAVADVASTYYPDSLRTEVLVARVLDLHPDWSVSSVKRGIVRLANRGVIELVTKDGKEGLWRFAA